MSILDFFKFKKNEDKKNVGDTSSSAAYTGINDAQEEEDSAPESNAQYEADSSSSVFDLGTSSSSDGGGGSDGGGS